MTNDQIKKIHDKFTTDPDWVLIEEMINEYLVPLEHVSTIDVTKGNDYIAAEVRARQISSEQLSKFLRDCRILGNSIKKSNVTFK